MKNLAIFLIFLFSFNASSIELSKLKVGDIILQPLNCWSCSLIEAQTESEFSHIGLVSRIDDSKVYIAEAFMSVREVSFKEFNTKTERGIKLKVLRPKYVNPELENVFRDSFEGLDYDSGFLWDDSEIYCSELLYKLFNNLNMDVPALLPMKFDVNAHYWDRYFRGKTPRGDLGVSPDDFDDESLYEFIGYI